MRITIIKNLLAFQPGGLLIPYYLLLSAKNTKSLSYNKSE